MNNVPDSVDVVLGPDAIIDPGVLLGYPSGRPGVVGSTRIGRGARVRAGSVIYAAVEIGDGFETGHHAIVREENRIGGQCTLWNNSTIDYGCIVGDRVKIHANCYVAQYTMLEDDVFLAPGVTIANDKYPGWDEAPVGLVGPRIRRGAQIGVNVTILPGIEIGAGALVGAGSVVTRDVAPGAVVVGNPATAVRTVAELRSAPGMRG